MKIALPFCLLFTAALLPGAVRYNAADSTWTLESGPAICRLKQVEGTIVLDYFGPAGKPGWKQPTTPPTLPALLRLDISATVEGHQLDDRDFRVVSHQTGSKTDGIDELLLVLEHAKLPLRVEAVYASYGDTGVFTRRLTAINTGSQPLRLVRMPSLHWRLPASDYELSYLHGQWGRERQLSTEPVNAGLRSFISRRGRSSAIYSPWFCLRDISLGVRYAAQLAWSGNWQMHFEKETGASGARAVPEVSVEMGLHNDFGGAMLLRPGERLALPYAAFTTTAGDLDDAVNQLHRYQLRYVIPKGEVNRPLVAQFNSWYPFRDVFTAADLKRGVDVAAQLGLDAYVIDDGWFPKQEGRGLFGDWWPDPKSFPDGMPAFADYVHSKGLKFGLWVEIELGASGSKVYKEHPEWFLTYRGTPIQSRRGPYMNFGHPEARAWAKAVIDRLVNEYKVEWIKFDYNVDYGDRFDGYEGDAIYRHVMGIYQFFDEVRASHPRLLIENCSSGGLRIDLGTIARSHTSWLSDVVTPKESMQLAYGCTVEFTPEVCNHWMVGDENRGQVDLSKPPGWWDFMFRVPMNGQFGISSRVEEWNEAIMKRAAANVALYKQVRDIIAGADVYHLSPPPDHDNPAGWMGLQYVSPQSGRSLLMAYRLGSSPASHTFRLRGLNTGATYRIAIDGAPRAAMTGGDLANKGLEVALDSEFRSAVIELTPGR